VGYTPARVIASLYEEAAPPGEESAGPVATRVREILQEVVARLDLDAAVSVHEDDEAIIATLTGGDLGRAIGRHGQTIHPLQYLVNGIVHRGDEHKPVVVDAAGYRARREATLATLAERTAARVRASGEAVALDPMTAVERKIVHVHLKELGLETRREGTAPNRYLVVSLPAG